MKFTSSSPCRCTLSAAGFQGAFLGGQEGLAPCLESWEQPAEDSESEPMASGLGEAAGEGEAARGPWLLLWGCRHSSPKAMLQSKSSSLSEPSPSYADDARDVTSRACRVALFRVASRCAGGAAPSFRATQFPSGLWRTGAAPGRGEQQAVVHRKEKQRVSLPQLTLQGERRA